MIEIAPKTFHPIHRQNGFSSKQPRFSEVKPQTFFNSILRLTKSDIQDEPKYGTQSRDEWLRKVWPQEPYLAGVISSVTSIDKNRGWTITGGRNQVRRFSTVLHDRFFYAPDLSGWRMSFGGSALSYYTSDLGSVTEIGRQGSTQGPLDSLYFVDPAKCQLTGSFDTPLRYFAPNGKTQAWKRDDYFRVSSLPSTNESQFGLGLCALSRCIELAKIMIGIYQYDNEMLLNRAPRGLLLLKGLTEDQWEDSMAGRKAKLDGDEKQYYGAIHVLAALDAGIELDAQMVSLSQLPAEFDQKIFTDLLMFGYALCFGYDPREFWPVSAGALGTATETEAQHKKAGAKGGLDFVLGFAEQLNREMPETLLFEFEERDLDGELANAEVEQAQADVVTSLYESGLKEAASLVSREEARILLAERGLIDSEWTENQEETVADDEGQERMLANERIQKAIWKYPDEPIVQYRFAVENGKEKREYKTLLKPRGQKRSFLFTRSLVKRQIDSEIDDYQQQLDDLAQQAVNGEIDQSEFQDRLEALTTAILTLSLLRGLDDQNESSDLLIDAASLILDDDSQEAQEAGLETLTDQVILEEALSDDANSQLQEEITLALGSVLADDIFAGRYSDDQIERLGIEQLLGRLKMWANAARGLLNFGRLVGRAQKNFLWALGATTEHCEDCLSSDGVTRTGAEWRALGLWPQSRNLACTGRRCLCTVTEV